MTSMYIKRQGFAWIYIKRFIHWFILGFLVLTCLTLLMIIAIRSEQDKNHDSSLKDEFFIIGAKRFTTWIYSVNSDNIREEQYAALDMIVDEKLKEERKLWLKRTNLIKDIESLPNNLSTKILWNTSSVSIISHKPNGYLYRRVEGDQITKTLLDLVKVEVDAVLEVSNGRRKPFNLLLSMVPQAYSDSNPFLVGIVGIRDAAKDPFVEEDL